MLNKDKEKVMRVSDSIKNNLPKSAAYDKQIYDDKHDEHVVSIYESIKNGSMNLGGYLVGYFGEHPNAYWAKNVFAVTDTNKAVIELPIENQAYKGKQIIGFVDVATEVEVEWYCDEDEKNWKQKVPVYIEVKSKINVGETIRQIKYYKSSCRDGSIWMVAAPGNLHSKLFEEQGIGYLSV